MGEFSGNNGRYSKNEVTVLHMTDATNDHKSQYAAGDSSERPWGKWMVLEVFPGSVLKRIEVKPGERLSLQLHRYRSEHWVVARGVARADVGNESTTLRVGESVNIPVGVEHRLSNVGEDVLVVSELQVGEVLSEDDIVRLSDDFGRSGE